MLKEKLKKYRKEMKLTQIQMAKMLDISRQSLSDLETGKNKGTVKLLKKLSEVTNKGFTYWGDEELEANYRNLQALDMFLENLIDNGQIDDNGDMEQNVMESVMRILKAEIIYKLSQKKEREN